MMKIKSNTQPTPWGLLLALGGSLLATPAQAQGTSNTNASIEEDDVVELSPFTVDTTSDVGYLAGNTLAGSRFNTSLKDTPAAISVLTSEFLSDIGAFDISEALAYAVNVEYVLDDDRAAVNGNSTINDYQQYRVRGLPASLSRNYFAWNLPTESALVDRIEDSRGPNSVLFGIASPGGLINAMTKQAQLGKSFRRASITFGSHDSFRGTLDINQPLIEGKLGLRLNAVHNETNTFRHYQYQESDRLHLAATYQLFDKTRIRAEFERGRIISNQPRAANLNNEFLYWYHIGRPTFDGIPADLDAFGLGRLGNNANVPRYTVVSNDGVTVAMRGQLRSDGDFGPWGDGPITDTAFADPSINVGGPDQDRYSYFSAFSAFIEHQFSENTFLELAYNHQGHEFDRYDPRSGPPQDLFGDPNNFRRDGTVNPYAGELYLEGHWFKTITDDESDAVRLMLSHQWDAGKWGNYRVAAMGEYTDSFGELSVYREIWVDAETGLPARNLGNPGSNQNIVWRRTYITEGDWGTYHIEGPGRRTGLLSNITEAETGRVFNSDWTARQHRYVEEELNTLMVAGQARYFDGRLILAGGFRRDDLSQHNLGTYRDPFNNYLLPAVDQPATGGETFLDTTGDTATFGAVYHITPNLSVFYNQSDNVSLPESFTRLPDSGEPGNPIPLDSPEGQGKDFGVAVTLLEGRLYARATVFETNAVGQSATSPPAPRNANERIMDALAAQGFISVEEAEFRSETGGRGIFDYASEGVEFQVIANVTEDWRFQVNYSYTDAQEDNLFNEWVAWHEINLAYLSQFDIDNIVTEGGITIAEEIDEYLSAPGTGLNTIIRNNGRSKLGNRQHKMNLFTRYNFSEGFLKGVYVGGGYRYQGEIYTGTISETDLTEVWAPTVGQADLLLGYSFPNLWKDRRLSMQLNIFNVLDETDPIVTRYSYDTGEALPFGYKPREGITWRLTTKFEF